MAALPPAAVAGSASWAHQAGALQSNGAVTVKSLSGGSYAGTQNPTGAVAKANQNAATQPPTVIIQATSAGVFNYTTDCYILKISGFSDVYIGAGKLDASNKFTGVLGNVSGTAQQTMFPGAIVLSMLTGASVATGSVNGVINPHWCGNDAACVNNYTGSGSGSVTGLTVSLVASLPTATWQKCYP